MSMASIRQHYGVPAYQHRKVKFRGDDCIILSADREGMYLWLSRFIFGRGTDRIKVHPTWEMDYLDGKGVR